MFISPWLARHMTRYARGK